MTDAQPHAEQRRVGSINVVAMVALAITGTYIIIFAAAYLLGAKDLLESRGVGYFLVTNTAVLAGYGIALLLNRRGSSDAAVAVLITTGIVNLLAATLVTGFESGNAAYLIVPAMAAILLTRRDSVFLRWGFVGASVAAYIVLLMLDPPTPDPIADTWIVDLQAAANFIGVVAFAVAIIWYQRRLADTAEDALAEANERSERLLLNVLPTDIAERLKDGESPIADSIPNATVLFADIVGFTSIADRSTADEVVSTLDDLFSAFDDIAADHGLEKIKTVGDNYFAVAGLRGKPDAAAVAADATLAMREESARHEFPGAGQVRMRFGLHTGSLVAGVIGKRKFSYDLWGDTVNTASRMESTSQPGRIQVSESTYEALRGAYELRSLGHVDIKGKGALATYELVGPSG